MRWLLVLVVVAACGRIGFDAGGGSGPGGGGGDGGGDGQAGEGGPGVDALVIPGCGGTKILVDDFADGTLDPAWMQVPSAGYTISETGGAMRVLFPAGALANTHAGYRQLASVAFNMTCAIAEVVQVPGVAADFAYLRLGTPTKYVQITVQNAQLVGSFDSNGTTGSVGPLPYDPVAHRFLRIRNAGGQNYNFEAGPSLDQFPTLLGSEGGSVVDPSPASLEIGGGTTAVGGAGSVVFASVTFVGP